MIGIVTLLLLQLRLAGVASAQSFPLDFPFRAQLPLTDDTFAIATGDLNGDGALDLVVGNQGQNYLYLNDGYSHLTQALPFGGNEFTVDTALGDVDNNGALDIVAYNMGAPSVVYRNSGDGVFTQAAQFAPASGVEDQLVLGDIDGDGDFDLVAARALAEGSIYLNNGQGGWAQAATLPAGLNPSLLDADGDGDLDLLVIQPDSAQPNRSYLYLYRNNGHGNFTGARLNLNGGKPFNQRFAAADLDHDGDLDFVISSRTRSGCTGNNCEDLRLVIDRGLLGYASIALDNAGAGALYLADLDNDGDLDIATTGLDADTQRADNLQSRVYLNNGINALLLTADFPSQAIGPEQVRPRDLALADLNADGILDIALGSSDANALYQGRAGQLFDRCQTNLLLIDPRLLVDLNGDGHLDLVLQSGLLMNDGKGNFQSSLSLPLTLELASQLAAADLNGDGRLDLIAIHPNRSGAIFLQSSNGQFSQAAQLDQESYPATSLAIGDINGDGTLDIVLGRGTAPGAATATPGENRLYFNDGNANFAPATLLNPVVDDTQALALGDVDADGDLDLVVANSQETQGQPQGKQNFLYLNDGSGHFSEQQLWGTGVDRTRSVALGDLNGDGQLDLVAGNSDQLNAIYYNDGSGDFAQAHLLGQLPDATAALLLVDLNHDRALDIIAANVRQSDALYLNDGLGQFAASPAFNEPVANARIFTMGAGDLDHDGDLDLVVDLQALSLIPQATDCMMQGHLVEPLQAPNRLPQVTVAQPGLTVGAGPYASPVTFAQQLIPIAFTLFDPEGKPATIHAYYSLNGGGQWFPAVPVATTITKDLATRTGAAPASHLFLWDVYASNFLGHSDHVLFRIEAEPSPRPRLRAVPGPYLRPSAAAETFPLRVRGTQVRVVNAAHVPVAGAMLYRLPAGATVRGDLFPVRNGTAIRTNRMGYLEGRGQLAVGDQLIALLPITATHAFTLYHTSAAPTPNGLDAYVVQAAGIQTLTVAAANPLILFDLAIALEWDARNDGTFLADLRSAIENASEILYDVTNGQVALGNVKIAQAKVGWASADVTIYASNSIHPRASMGGVVITPTSEIGISGVITNAYLPGQVRMGPQWDPFGQSEAELRQDWWLAFAHELSHYLLFLPDNYLGIDNGLLRQIDCQGSFMTNTYEEPYREFLTRDQWERQEACRTKSIAAHTTGRADWETIHHFLPWLQAPASGATVNPGPAWLPLQVTRIHIADPVGSSFSPVLPARNFDLREATGGQVIQVRQAEGYLFKTRSTSQIEDDTVISLGSTGAGSDRLKVRGAEVGDRLCIFAGSGATPRLGCEVITNNSTSLRLQSVPGWQPAIAVTPVSSTTLAITVTQHVSPGLELRVQVFPAYGAPGQTTPVVAPWRVLQPIDPTTLQQFATVMTLDAPAFEGFVRVWLANASLSYEAITQFYLSAGWGPNNRLTSGAPGQVWGPNNRLTSGANSRAWGANHRDLAAPMASGDGKVTIFHVDDGLSTPSVAALQALSTLPALPLWLTPVGQGYRIAITADFPGTIAFHYLEREAPKGYEHTLTVYYQMDGSDEWQRLSTFLDPAENLAAASIPQNQVRGQGIYALLATVEMPALMQGWNLFAYPIPGERPVANALASMADAYTSVYHFAPTRQPTWQLYDATVVMQHPTYAGLVNDLDQLTFGQSYWLYATQAITPYLAIAETLNDRTVGAARLADEPTLPPATFYGPIEGGENLRLTAGMEITATVNGVLCGQGKVTPLNDLWAYKIQVAAAVNYNGCGSLGSTVHFVVASKAVAEAPLWDNRQAQYQALTVTAQTGALPTPDPDFSGSDGAHAAYTIFLPVIQR
ncbi:MAG: VCBS repeat-containing protein [Caldilineaceae bacterium]